MFKAAFSFDGRIRRTEYGLSLIIYTVVLTILQLIIGTMIASSSRSYYSSNDDSGGAGVLLFIFIIPLLWFLWAQGAKRCHDVGNSGWWQLIPFYVFALIFQEGASGPNQYGDDPKNSNLSNTQNYTSTIHQQQTNNTGGYQGGYTGGHNNPNTGNALNPNQQDSGEYKSGDLYR